ncbi:MAG: heme NO-binding domain-containing protein [Vicingaceae bacterium]
MKGIVFTEFLEMVEDKFGLLTLDKVVEENKLASGGAYTAVGTYDHAEMVLLVTNLSKEVNVPVGDLLEVYGKHFFDVLLQSYPSFFQGVKSAFQFLSSIENHIHVEVLKLYPDAELPSFDISQVDDKTLKMVYHSERKLAAFAKGLIEGCIAYFKEDIQVEMKALKEDHSVVEFRLHKK